MSARMLSTVSSITFSGSVGPCGLGAGALLALGAADASALDADVASAAVGAFFSGSDLQWQPALNAAPHSTSS